MSSTTSTLQDPTTRAGGWWRTVRWTAITLAVSMLAVVVTAASEESVAAAPPRDPCSGIVLVGPDDRYIDRPGTIIQIGSPSAPICRFEQQALAEHAAERGAPWDDLQQARMLSWGRDAARAAIFTELLEVIAKPAGERTADEQAAYSWLQQRVRALRVTQAERSLAEYRKWEPMPCSYVPPTGFHYDPGCVDGSLLQLFTGPPRPPAYEDFVGYGIVATLNQLYTDNGGLNAGRTARFLEHAIIVGGVAAAIGIAGVTAAAMGATLAALLPFATAGFALGVAGPLLVAGVVIFLAITAIVRFIQINEDSQIPGQLEADLTAAQSTLPDLATLTGTEDGMATLFAAFVDSTFPDHPNPSFKPAAPAAPDDSTPGFLVSGGSRTGPRFDQVISFVDETGTVNQAWIDDGWWVIDPPGADPNRLSLEITYQDSAGGLWSATIDGDELVVVDADSSQSKRDCPAPVCQRTTTLQLRGQLPEDPDPKPVSNLTARLVGQPIHFTETPTLAPSYDEGDSVELTATALTHPESGPVSYRWLVRRENAHAPGTFLDTYYDGQTVTHTFTAGGPHLIEAIATDATGATARAQVSTTVTALPTTLDVFQRQPASGPSMPAVGPWWEGQSGGVLVVSTGEANTLFEVDWDVDGTYDTSATSTTPLETWIPQPQTYAEGSHPIRVRATADDGNVVVREYALIVMNRNPSGADVEVFVDGAWRDLGTDLPSNPDFVEGDTVTARYRVFDPGPDDLLDAVVRWSDGTTQYHADVAPGEWHTVSHLYLDEATSAVGIEVDALDETGAAITPAAARGYAYYSVHPVLPQVTELTTTVDPDGVATLEARYDDLPYDADRFTIDWGDGSPPTEMSLPMYLPPGDPEVEGSAAFWKFSLDELVASHTYAEPGTYTATLEIYEGLPAPTTVTTPIVFDNRRPGIVGMGQLDVAPGLLVQLDVEATDPDEHDPDDQLTVLIDWGDGTQSEAPWNPLDQTHSGVHPYAATGTYDVTLTATDPGGAASAPVKGTIVVTDVEPGRLEASPASVDFGVVEVATLTTEIVTVTNAGGYPLAIDGVSVDGPSFAVVDNDCAVSLELSPGETCDVTVVFGPGTEGDAAGSLEVTAGLDTLTIGLSGTGALVTAPVLDPSEVDFGDVPVGASVSRTVTVTNDGVLPADIAGIGVGDGVGPAGPSYDGFSVVDETCPDVLEPTASCSVVVGFAASDLGPQAAVLQIDGDVVATTTLAADTVEPGALTADPTSIDFGIVEVGTATTGTTVTVTNDGGYPVEVGAVGLDDAGADRFSLEDDGCSGVTLAPTASCEIVVTFQPDAEGAVTGSLVVLGDTGTDPLAVPLAGIGALVVAPTFDPASLDLGDVPTNATRQQVFTVTNGGLLPADVTAVGLSDGGTGPAPSWDGFSIVGETCPDVLAPGGSCTVTVGFAPLRLGAHVAELVVDGDAPAGAALAANGVEPGELTAEPAAVDFGAVEVGTVSPAASVAFTNTGGYPVAIGAVSWTGADSITITTDTCTAATIAPGATCDVSVVFAPIAEGPASGSIVVPNDSDAGSTVVEAGGIGAVASPPSITPPSVDFGEVEEGETAERDVTVTNDGLLPVVIDGAEVVGVQGGAVDVRRAAAAGPAADGFSLVADTCSGTTLTAGASCTVRVRFAPQRSGLHEAVLSIAGDVAASARLLGQGVEPTPPPTNPTVPTNPATPADPAGGAGPYGANGGVGPYASGGAGYGTGLPATGSDFRAALALAVLLVLAGLAALAASTRRAHAHGARGLLSDTDAGDRNDG